MNERLNLGIIIPTLNSERFLEHTLISLKGLVSAGARVLIVDSDSMDQTLQIAARHGVEVINESAGNMYRAINRGIESLDNEWVTYINSDDLLYSDSIINAMSTIGAGVDMIYGNIDYIDELGRYLHGWRSPSASKVSRYLKIYNPFPQQGTCFRKIVWEQLSGFDEKYRYSSDRDFFTRICLRGFRVGKYCEGRIAGFRLHGDQLSQTVNRLMDKECEAMSVEWAGESPSSMRLNLLKCSFRLRNIDSYIIRILRRFQCSGHFSLSKSIEDFKLDTSD
jgi:glycosyltransferase involved in cell wall biosynthesis